MRATLTKTMALRQGTPLEIVQSQLALLPGENRPPRPFRRAIARHAILPVELSTILLKAQSTIRCYGTPMGWSFTKV